MKKQLPYSYGKSEGTETKKGKRGDEFRMWLIGYTERERGHEFVYIEKDGRRSKETGQRVGV